MFLMYSTATCTAFWILEENGIINKPISYTFLQSWSLWQLKEHTEAMNGGMVIRLKSVWMTWFKWVFFGIAEGTKALTGWLSII